MINLITEHMDIWTTAQVQTSNGGRGRGKNSNGQSPHGIQKLRELILELAVRGKLVPQDPKDGSASVLLKKIAEKKSKLVKERIIKKQKKLPEINDYEKPFELPNAWVWTRLGDVTNYGITEKAEPDDVDEETWVLELADIEKVTSKLLNKVRFADRDFRSSKNRFFKGDVIYGKLRPYLDKVIVADENGVCTTEMIPLRGYAKITPQYLRLVMKCPYFIRHANESTHGMNLPRLGTEKARMALFPLTSEAEQHRIVAKVDELMALCDRLEQEQTDSNETHQILVETLLATLTNTANQREFAKAWQRIANHFDTLFTTEQSIDQLKQTILQLAVMGKLVAQDPNDEPASVLLEKITSEKSRLTKEGKIKKKKTLPVIDKETRPFTLPLNWEWVRFGELINSRLGKMLDKAKNKGEPKQYLRNTNVQWNRFDLTDLKEFKLEESEQHEFQVHPGDLLICEGGEPGRCAIWQGEIEEIYFQKALHRVRTLCGIPPQFLMINFMNDASNGRLSQYFTGATIKHLPGDKLARYLIPVAPIKEQHRIVAKVDELMSLCDSLSNCLKKSQSTKVFLANTLVEQSVE